MALAFVLSCGLFGTVNTFIGATSAQAAPGEPFDPARPQVFVAQVGGGSTGLFRSITDQSGATSFEPEGVPINVEYNAIAFNPADNYIYGLTTSDGAGVPTGSFIRIGEENVVTRVGSTLYGTLANTGVMGPDGLYYGMNGNDNDYMWVIEPETGEHLGDLTLSEVPVVSDVSMVDGHFWGVENSSSALVRIDPETGTVSRFSGVLPEITTAGSVWTFGNGNLGVKDNDSGLVYQVLVTDAGSDAPGFSLISIAQGPGNSNSDGTAIAGDPVDLQIEKSVPAEFVPGGQIVYTLAVTNNGPGVPSGYTVIDELPAGLSNPQAPGCTFEGATVTCLGGEIAVGEVVEITITADVAAEQTECIVNTGAVIGNEQDPDETNNEDSATSCAATATLSSWKSVSASDTPVVAGTVLTYTLFFENTGPVPAVVDELDDLTHVADDADLTTEPTSTDGLDVARDGDILAITGEVAPGDTASVTYQVTVRAEGERGDHIAANFLIPNDPGRPPVTEPVCQPEDVERPNCTVTPIGSLLTGKSVTADSEPIGAGTVLTYTLTFDNQGRGPVNVDYTDLLTDVLDDADLTTAPIASDGALTLSEVADERFAVVGELAAGQAVTVNYQVTVREETDRGNSSADNFLIPTDEDPPEECVDGDPNCTTTPLPLVGVDKTADPDTGSQVQAGQDVSYILTFTNSGEAAGAVDYTDDLAAVLDDADLTGAPTSSAEALDTTDGTDGQIRVTGVLEPGQTATVSYSVTVKPDGARGDSELRNVVAKTGTVDPDCGDPTVACTEHPIEPGNVDPPSGASGETLPQTGVGASSPAIIAAVALLVAGGVLFAAARRREASVGEGRQDATIDDLM